MPDAPDIGIGPVSGDTPPPPPASPDTSSTPTPSGPNPPAPPSDIEYRAGTAKPAAGLQTQESKAWTNAAPKLSEQPAQNMTVMQPLRRHGIAGVFDEIGKFMSGEQGAGIYIDDKGQIYHQSAPMTTAQRWASIGLQALIGAGKGLAAGQGPGGAGRALAAGAQSGFEMRQAADKQKTEEATKSWEMQRQTRMDNANLQMQQAKLAQMALENDRTNQLLSDDQMKMTDYQVDRVKAAGGYLIGNGRIYTSDDYHKMLEDEPAALKDHFGNSSIIPIQHYDPVTHKADGLQLGKIPPDRLNAPVAEGTTVPVYVAAPTAENPGAYRTDWKPLADGSTELQREQAVNQYTDQIDRAQKVTLQTADVGIKQEELKEKPEAFKTEQKLKAGQTAQAYAAARKDDADARAADARAKGGDPEAHASYGESVAQGKLTLDEVPAADRGGTERYLTEHHPNLDQKSVMLTAREHEKQQLANVGQENLDQIQTVLNRRPDIIGALSGRKKGFSELVGTDDRDYGILNPALDNYAMAAVGLHGSKNYANKDDAKRDLLQGFTAGKDYADAAIATARQSMDQFTGKPRGIDGTPYIYRTQPPPGTPAPGAAPAGAPQVVSLSKAMQLPINKGKTADQVKADIIAHKMQVIP